MADSKVPIVTDTEVDLSDEGLGIDASASPEPEVAAAPEVQAPAAPADFGGFKSSDELIKAHKDLQGLYQKSRNDFYQMQEQLRQLTPIVQEYQKSKQAPPPKEEEFDIPRFLETFINGPDKAINSIAGKHFEAQLKKFAEDQLTPLQRELEQMRNEKAVDRFMSEHSELTAEDEDALLNVIRETPWIQGIAAVSDKLDAAYSMLLRKEPTRFSERSEATPQRQGLQQIKQAASSMGAKAGTRARQNKDEFDEVLDLDREQSALWR